MTQGLLAAGPTHTCSVKAEHRRAPTVDAPRKQTCLLPTPSRDFRAAAAHLDAGALQVAVLRPERLKLRLCGEVDVQAGHAKLVCHLWQQGG